MAERRSPKTARIQKKPSAARRPKDREASALQRERKESEKIQSIAVWIVALTALLLIGAIIYHEATKEPNVPVPTSGTPGTETSHAAAINPVKPSSATTQSNPEDKGSDDSPAVAQNETPEPVKPEPKKTVKTDSEEPTVGRATATGFEGPQDQYGTEKKDPLGYYPYGYDWVPLEERNQLERKLRDVVEFKMSGAELETLKREMTKVGWKVVPVVLNFWRKTDWENQDSVLASKDLAAILERITGKGGNPSDELHFDPMNDNLPTLKYRVRGWIKYWMTIADEHKEEITKSAGG